MQNKKSFEHGEKEGHDMHRGFMRETSDILADRRRVFENDSGVRRPSEAVLLT